MKEVASRLSEEYECVFVDFQNATTPQDAIAELSLALRDHMSLWKKTQNLFANILSSIEKVGGNDLSIVLRAGLTEGNWAAKGDDLFEILAGSEKPVLLLMDEVPILVNRIIKGTDYVITPARRHCTGEFMSWLRKNSLKHQGKIRMVISCSIGFEPVLRQADLSATINNFYPFDLKPWTEATAIGCLHALAVQYKIGFRDNAEQEMVSRLGCCIPHHIQMFFDHVRTYCMRHKCNEVGPEQVEEVYLTEMLSTRGHAELTHYEERLKLVLGAEKTALAVDMITEAAVVGRLTSEAIQHLQNDYTFEGETTAEVQREILWVLSHDGYLFKTEKGYKFVSQLLCAWWKGRHEMFFTPVLDREM